MALIVMNRKFFSSLNKNDTDNALLNGKNDRIQYEMCSKYSLKWLKMDKYFDLVRCITVIIFPPDIIL